MADSTKESPRFWLRLRKTSQFIFLLTFLFLFIKTDYSGKDEIEYAVNIFFRLNPLLATCAMLAGKTFILLFFPALITLILTFFFGRFFCGWFCPLGTLIDYTNKFWRKQRTTKAEQNNFPRFRYILLIFILFGSLFGFPIAGYFDPFSLLVRGLTISVFPAFNDAVSSFFTMTYQFGPDWLNMVTEPIYSVLKETVLPFKQKYYSLSLISLFLLLIIFFLEKYGRRFFCNNICPLGAFLSLVSRFAFLRGFSDLNNCTDCKMCQTACRMDAINDQQEIAPDRCNLCLDCTILCPTSAIDFHFGGTGQKAPFHFLSRRSFVNSMVAGTFLPFVLNTRLLAKKSNPKLIRPPGALLEKEFLGTCVRCGECMKVCITNALQPVLLEAGVEGIFTPYLIPKIGYCEYNCSLCGQVCPSGAIKKLSIEEKQKAVIGWAEFDKNKCLPYAKGIPCIVCEEHCPTPDKAIKFRKAIVMSMDNKPVEVKQPYIIDKLCVGCGICENKCPVQGEAAVRITNAGELRGDNDNTTEGSYEYN